jgi:2-iminobutanoate/2-iminopropanoate deaminase
MEKQVIKTSKAPAAIGPYSQAIIAGGFVFLSGQIPIHPATGQIVNGDIHEQTLRVLRNVEQILVEAGTSLNHVVKVTIYLKDLRNYAAMNDAYATFFEAAKPARACVEVARLPKEAHIEIDVIALMP